MGEIAITTLYLITVVVWFDLTVFEGDFHVDDCRAAKTSIEERFDVEATCLTQSDGSLIVNDVVYEG